MGNIELVSDGEGVVVAGDKLAVERFLERAGLLPSVERVELRKLSTLLRLTSDVAETASGIAEQSAFYLKLTPESAKRLKDAGGLMKTKTKGIKHAMLGEPGSRSLKWLQVEDGPASLLTNPAVLSGIGGLMSQFAHQAEAQELRALLVRMDEKLDAVRRAQRDAVLASMNGAAAAVEEAMTIHRHGGDPETLWAKVSGESGAIFKVQESALLALGALADKVEGKSKVGELKKVTEEVQRDIVVQLAILARCFDLQDDFRVVELDHVLASAPANFDGHRLGVSEARESRRAAVLKYTSLLMQRLNVAGDIANANVLLHARAARSILDSLDATGEIVGDFHVPLGIEANHEVVCAVRWGAALRDPQQLKKAGAEVSQKAAIAGGGVAMVALGAVGLKNMPKDGGA